METAIIVIVGIAIMIVITAGPVAILATLAHACASFTKGGDDFIEIPDPIEAMEGRGVINRHE